MFHPSIYTRMELIQHLGVIPDPSPTLRSVFYKAKGLVVLYCLLKVVVCYHFISVGCSVMKYIFPEFNDIKKMCGVYFWDVCIYLMVRNCYISIFQIFHIIARFSHLVGKITTNDLRFYSFSSMC